MELRRIYLDTNILVEAIEDSNSPAATLMRLAAAGHFCVVESDYLLDEIDRVVGNLYGARIASAQRAQMRAFPNAELILSPTWRLKLLEVDPFIRDVADSPHFAAARAGKTDVLVSKNRRSIRVGMFAVVPLALPEDVLPALLGEAEWPTPGALRTRWEQWARRSPRSPRP